jgi:glycosyltransferase involved in cell wall biosynthesis
MGGAQYQCHLLAEELGRRAGAEVFFLARCIPNVSATPALSYGLRCIGNTRGIRRRAVFFDAAGLWRALCELKPDVIYQRMKQSYTAVCAAYARRHGSRLVFHVASDADLDRRLVRNERWWTRRLPFEIVEAVAGNWGVCRADEVVVQSRRQAAMLRDAFHRDPSTVIRNFQPLPATLPAKANRPIKVVWVANIKAVKRPEIFAQLAWEFRHRKDVEFIMAGRPGKHRPFTALMPQIGSRGNLHFLGELSLDAANDLLAQAHIFVSTSRIEGSPNTFIQAWARGAVVVSLDVDVDDGMNSMGIGFHVETFQSLKVVVGRLVDSAEERHAAVDRAFKYVHREHSLDNAVVLADMISGGTRAHGNQLERTTRSLPAN